MKQEIGARSKLRKYFLENIGVILDSETLQKVSGGISEWARRVRELRDEEGYQIKTHNDLGHLKPGQYILISDKPIPAFSRAMSKEIRAMVLERNGFTCQMCGAVAGEPHPFDLTKKTRLHIGHIIDKSKGGTDDYSNLRALCSVCNEGAANISPDRPSHLVLLTQIRRATKEDQLKILDWLQVKYPDFKRTT